MIPICSGVVIRKQISRDHFGKNSSHTTNSSTISVNAAVNV
jgi:hypothetical protein